MAKTSDQSVQLVDAPNLSVTTIMESIPDAIVVADFESGKIVAANDAASDLFECRVDDLIGRNHLQLHPAADAALYKEAFRRGLESEQVDRLENGDLLYVETSDGDRKPVEINAQRIQTDGRQLVLGVFRDISGRIEREKQLEETTTRLNTLVDATPLPVAALDTDGRVQLWNQAATELFGYRSSEVVGERYPLFVDDAELDELLGEVLDGNSFDGYETVYRARDGSRVHVEIYARPLYTDGEITGAIGSAVDVTDSKRRSQRLDVLHRLLRHDLRNKLVVIQGYASMLSNQDATGGPSKQEAAEKIVAATEELTELSNHATQVRKVVNANKTGVTAVSELVATIQDIEPTMPAISFDLPPPHDEATVPSQANKAVSWLLERIGEHVDDSAIEITVDIQSGFVQVDIRGTSPLLSKGDAELITNGKETALKHGSDLDIARAYMTIAGLGGDILQLDNIQPERAFTIEIPRTDKQTVA